MNSVGAFDRQRNVAAVALPTHGHPAANGVIVTLGEIEAADEIRRHPHLAAVVARGVYSYARDILDEPRRNIAEKVMIERIRALTLPQEILGQGGEPPCDEVAVGGVIRPRYQLIGKLGLAVVGKHAEQAPCAEDAAVHMVVGVGDYFQQHLERLSLLALVKYVVIYRHRLRGLAAAYRRAGVQVDKMLPDGGADLTAQLHAEFLLQRLTEHGEDIRRLVKDIHADHAVSEFKRGFELCHGAPVAKPQLHRAPRGSVP